MVPARRIIAVSPERALRVRFEESLRAAAAPEVEVEVQSALDGTGVAEPAALYVVHVAGELLRVPGLLAPRLPGAGPIIAVLPKPSLAGAVELMQASERIAAVLVAEELEIQQLAAVAARLVADDVLGLAQVLAPGTAVRTEEVGDAREKARCIAHVVGFAGEVGAPRQLHGPIEQCLDEMLMNALYDAPVDARGRHVFEGVAAKDRLAQRTDQRAVVQYGCDGRRLAISVRDAFGSLERRTVLRHLHKGLHAEQKVDRKVGGAGLGLYLMATSAEAVYFHVLPGAATEALCVFDLGATAPRLAQLGFLVQRDLRGLAPARPARRRSAAPRGRGWIAAAAVVALAAVGGAVAWRYAGGGRAGQAAVATVELDSEPSGAGVEIDGRPAGSTPLSLTTLAPGASVSAVIKRTGYRTATVRLDAPAAGETRRVVQPLALSDDFVRVRFVSRPAGAEVVKDGQAASVDRTYTPAEVLAPVGQVQRFTLKMPRHVPLVIEPFTPARGERGLEKGGELVPGASLHLEAAAGGKATVRGAPHCVDVALPFDCTLAPGTYVVEYAAPDGAKGTRTVAMGAQDTTVPLAPTPAAPPPKQ
jgi:hypothetical protein